MNQGDGHSLVLNNNKCINLAKMREEDICEVIVQQLQYILAHEINCYNAVFIDTLQCARYVLIPKVQINY